MKPDLLDLAARLTAAAEPFALAQVVRREPPTSARVGDAAIVTADGSFHGWVGGSCTRPTVVREALAALADGQPRLIALDPDPGATRPDGITVFPMTCHSRGRVDVYIEPTLPTPGLYVFGVTPVARALVRLGAGMGYQVTAVDPDADGETFPEAAGVLEALEEGVARGSARCLAVVATQGQWDEPAAAQALALAPDYLGVVASGRRFEEIRAFLEQQGADPSALDRISSPAGLDIGALTAEEIAISILAEMVQVVRSRDAERSGTEGVEVGPASTEQIDPICGMSVIPGPETPRAEHDGRTYYFCCGHCRARFLQDPAAHAGAAGS
ncbi:MAG: XdhC family protein [Gemmatimonadota bacterium]